MESAQMNAFVIALANQVCRLLLSPRASNGMSVKEIAEALDIPRKGYPDREIHKYPAMNDAIVHGLMAYLVREGVVTYSSETRPGRYFAAIPTSKKF